MIATPTDPRQADPRLQAATQWLQSVLGRAPDQLVPVAGDASFRRYFRVHLGDQHWILMDAPPDREAIAPFIDIDHRLRHAGLLAPEIVHAQVRLGFLLLEDLGDVLMRERVAPDKGETYLQQLLPVLTTMAREVDADGLPAYSELKLRDELDLFTDWYLAKHHELHLDDQQQQVWQQLCALLIGSARQQPQVFVHRDFHSCNLLDAGNGRIGVIDFQDAVQGPLTYDFASLVWDRYITWPRDTLLRWMETFRVTVAPGTDPDQWVQWCDWMGLQRNLKIVGIFARLSYRDRKEGYLEMIPRFWSYLQDVLPRYPETHAFRKLLEEVQCAP